MKNLMPFVAIVGLAATFLPAVAYLAGAVQKDTMTTWMLVGTIVWFVAAPVWMGARPADSERS